MDRKNVSNAAIAGMLVDLNLNRGPGYNLVNMSFFITYILLQPLMIILCRKVGPRMFLPGICLAWGIVVIGFGFSKTWPTLIPLRLVLGVLEAGYFPGCLYLLSCWYTRCTQPGLNERDLLTMRSRGGEAVFRLLPYWQRGLGAQRHHRVRLAADGGR
jgi:MFS family permease